MNAVLEMEKSIRCLALELPEPVYDDVKTKWVAVKGYIEKLKKGDTNVQSN